jgi:hypothetical protein
LWPARLIVLAIWLFVTLISVINVVVHSNSNNLYDVPTPVSLIFHQRFYSEVFGLVLVLGRQSLYASKDRWRIYLAMDGLILLRYFVHPPLLLE